MSLVTEPAGRAPGRVPVAAPVAVAVDIGSEYVGVWASERGIAGAETARTARAAGTVVRRGRIVDRDRCAAILTGVLDSYDEPVPPGGVVVAGRPVLATPADQDALAEVVARVLRPSRMVFVDSVRAGAVGSGAVAGTLLIADVGGQLSEVALLDDAAVVAARRMDVGTRDLAQGANVPTLATLVANLVRALRRDVAHHPGAAAAEARGLVLVGDGALHPEFTARLGAHLRMPVHCAASPRTAVLTGAGLVARSVLRQPLG